MIFLRNWLITSNEPIPKEYHVSTNEYSLAEAEKVFRSFVFATVYPISASYVGKVITMEPAGGE
jgi:hypothetical protein